MSAFNPQHRHSHLSSRITTALYRISQAIDRLFRVRAEQEQLSPTQIQALLFLRYARPGVQTIGGLASRLGTSFATASSTMTALERKGLAARSPLPADRRTITLSLTDAGRGQAQGLDDLLDEVSAAIGELPLEQQQALEKAAQAIVQRLHQAGYVQLYEMCWGCQFFRHNAHPDHPEGAHHCAFMDAPLAEPDTYLECPDAVPISAEGGAMQPP